VFGAGGGTSSYKEVEETDLVVLWGSNARETHPIFFHHVLKALHRGAKLMTVDPRRTASAKWADLWLGIDVGSDCALSNTIARELIHSDLIDEGFIKRATTGYEEYAASVEPFTLEEGERLTGVPAAAIKQLAHAYGRADRAVICWTLGITEHHNAVDNVLALINLGLLTGHVGKYGSGLNPLRGQNNVQGGGDMGAIPNKLSGFQDIEKDAGARERFKAAWGVEIDPHYGWHLTQMFEAMERGELRTLYVIGENPAQSEADQTKARKLLSGLDCLIVQDLVLTKTAEMADVVFPGSASWVEASGTVTNSERRVQLCRKALDPPGDARDDNWIITELAKRMGYDWGPPVAEEIWDEVRSLSPMHGGMSYARLAEHDGLQWPCLTEDDPGAQFLHGRLWEDPIEGPPAPFSVTPHSPPVEGLDDEYPMRLTTGRRLESYNTGVQSGGYRSPLHRGETLDLSPEDAVELELEPGEIARIFSRRGSVEAPVRIDRSLRRGLAFMTFHFPDQVETNVLTIDATDPRSGTAEFKAAAIRVEKIPVTETAERTNGVQEREPVAVGAGGNGAGGNGAAGKGAGNGAAKPSREAV
jgi:predicted molibdopterin-dependent oxidoreductase YjgC